MGYSIVWVVVLLVLGQAWGNPVVLFEVINIYEVRLKLNGDSEASSRRGFKQPYHDGEQRPLAASLTQRLASHAPALTEARNQDARLPLPGLPSPQELDAIKKVAQILVMLGEQVIPSIIGDLPSPGHGNNCDQMPPEDIPNDPIKGN